MMNSKFLKVICIALAWSTSLVAQSHQWTLDECIDYAKEHNISLKQTDTQRQIQDLNHNTAKHSWEPTVAMIAIENFSVAFNNGSNSYTSFTPVFYAQMNLFDGFLARYNEKMNKWSLTSIVAQEEQAAKDLTINIASYYLQVLYLQGRVDISRKQVEIGKELCDKIGQQVRTGRLSDSQLTEVEALQSSYEYALTSTQGSYDLALLTLKHMLNLPAGEEFAVAPIPDDVLSTALPMSSMDYYNEAVGSYPAIRAAEAAIESNKAAVGYYKSQLYPQLSLLFQLYTTNNQYYYNPQNRSILGSTRTQWHNNFGILPNLQLTIPIYTKHSYINSVRTAKLNVTNSQLALESTLQSLREVIEQNWTQANNAIRQHEAAVKSEASASKNYQNEEYRYLSGRSDIYSLNQSRQLWLDAQNQALQAKYEYLIRRRILEFYINSKF